MKSEAKKVDIYRLFNVDNEYLDPVLTEAKYQLGTVEFHFKPGEEFVPYISLEEMAGLYGRFYKDKNATSHKVSLEGKKWSWAVKNADKEVFASSIDTSAKTFTYSGDLSGVITPKKDHSKHSVLLHAKLENSKITLSSSHAPIVSYADTEFETFEEEGKTYFPFSMLHTFYHELTGHDFFYNYKSLFEYNEITDLTGADITDKDDNVFKLTDQMAEVIHEKVKEKDVSSKPLMPMYARKHHRAEFLLTMDQYYGLRKSWGVERMSDLYKAYGLYDAFIDANSAVRGAAYSKAFFLLGDNHTVRVLLGDDPWTESNGNADISPATSSPLVEERRLLSNALTAQRNAFLKENGFNEGIKDAVVYSKDGKIAYFGFDSFDAIANAYKSDGTLQSLDFLASGDSYFYFLKQLSAIKAHETDVLGNKVKVEKVIIDDSLNGGGYMYTMGKLLALLSKQNQGSIYALNTLSDTISKALYQVDSNQDGKYDASDVFGNDFKFYILTSPISFSCGNAFPIYARAYDNVYTIGVKSGGGECPVSENYISNGMGYAYSSEDRIIVFDETKKTYEGVESGTSIDGVLSYNAFYNMDEMAKAIDSIRS